MNEYVFCALKTDLPTWISGKTRAYCKEEIEVRNDFLSCTFDWKNRRKVEINKQWKQLIPYIIITDTNGNMLIYNRNGNETRLHGLWSCGIGGHINPIDKGSNWFETVSNGARREMEEETGLNGHLSFLGVIDEEESEVGEVHLGIVFHFQVSNFNNLIQSEELETSLFLPIEEIKNKSLELWSKLALSLFPRLLIVMNHALNKEQCLSLFNLSILNLISPELEIQEKMKKITPEGSLNRDLLDSLTYWIREYTRERDLVLIQGEFC